MGLNFPNAPVVGDLWPQPPVPNVPVYRWDGEKWGMKFVPAAAKAAVWTDGSAPMTGQLTLAGDPVANTDAADKHYVDNKIATGAVASFKTRTGAVVPVQGDYPTSLIPGTTTNDNAAAGNIGEYQVAALGSGSSTPLVSNTPKTVIGLAL